ncbi:hypothetical protein DM02DRAFT_732748 [Periconia macrospinosa]|uniref:Uncharacterized protein n=1 Tax=Periconia macrospinosa TaxID=97972 RepID=A0A2V1D7G4_9PLEO|nr:hypothetical protein DM02DRAFT_732748 [Periconia macrospinosa]
MGNFRVLAAAFAVVSVFDGANAHPGEQHSAAHVKREIERYSSAHAQAARAFAKIHEFPDAAALKERAIARQFVTWSEKRGIISKPSFGKRTLEDLESCSLNNPLEVTAPYNENTQSLTKLVDGTIAQEVNSASRPNTSSSSSRRFENFPEFGWTIGLTSKATSTSNDGDRLPMLRRHGGRGQRWCLGDTRELLNSPTKYWCKVELQVRSRSSGKITSAFRMSLESGVKDRTFPLVIAIQVRCIDLDW